MSVMTIERGVFREVAKKLFYMAMNKTCDINYSYVTSKYEMDDEPTVYNFVNQLMHLNELSYAHRYNEKIFRSKPIQDFGAKLQSISTIQTLMYLQCIQYNIERSTIAANQPITPVQDNALKILGELIPDLMGTIIRQLPEYKAAKYCDL